MRLTVAKFGKPHGLKGEVGVVVHTDNPAERFVAGAVLETEPADKGPVTIVRSRNINGRWFVAIEGVSSREAAEALRGIELVVDGEASDEEDAWYPHELAGLRAELEDGTVVGEVTGLENLPAHDMLLIRETSGETTMVPFVTAIVPVVDVPGGRVVLTPPGGLLARDAHLLEVAGPPETIGESEPDDDAAQPEN